MIPNPHEYFYSAFCLGEKGLDHVFYISRDGKKLNIKIHLYSVI